MQKDKEPRRPQEGQVLEVTPLRYRNVMIVFRDPSDKMWPSFFFGDAEGDGSFVYTTKEKPKANFTLQCTYIANTAGEQTRRAMGELIREMPGAENPGAKGKGKSNLEPVVRFVLTDMSPWRMEEVPTIRGDVKRIGYRVVCNLSGDLHVGERQIALKDILCRAHFPVNAARHIRGDPNAVPNAAEMSARFAVKGAELGLKSLQIQGDIQVHMTWTGHSDITYWVPPKVEPKAGELKVRE